MEFITGRLYRNLEFLEWVGQNCIEEPERGAALAAFTWLKNRYPDIVPIVRGELIDEFTQKK